MGKETYHCCVCGAQREKYSSQVTGKRFYCSHRCRYSGMSIHNTGSENPNYRHGKHTNEHKCSCGRGMDYRAGRCVYCRQDKDLNVLSYFVDGKIVRNATLWRYIKSMNLIPWDKCLHCSQGWEYNGKPLSLHLDHINGTPTDNRLENLRVLCPNCHSQTPTYASKNRRLK